MPDQSNSYTFNGSFSNQDTKADAWSIGTAKEAKSGRQLIARYRSFQPTNIKSSDYPHPIAFSWQFESETGMPSKNVKQRMNYLEETFEKVLESANAGFLIGLVTGNGRAEWLFYARDRDEFMHLLNSSFPSGEMFPINVSHLGIDPDWSAFQQMQKTYNQPPRT